MSRCLLALTSEKAGELDKTSGSDAALKDGFAC